MESDTVNVKQYVQGDVFLYAAKVPKAAKIKPRATKGLVLAEGEATGHAHVIEQEAELFEANGVFYLRNSKPVEIKHEEHKPVSIPAGEWRVGIVQEYDEFEQSAQNVRD